MAAVEDSTVPVLRDRHTQHLQCYSDNPGRRNFEKTALRNYPGAKLLPSCVPSCETHCTSTAATWALHPLFVPVAATAPVRRGTLCNMHLCVRSFRCTCSVRISHLPRTSCAESLTFFMIDHIDHHSPTSAAVFMDTIAVSVTSMVNPGAIGYEDPSRSSRNTSMSGTCFGCTVATSTTAVIALLTSVARRALVPQTSFRANKRAPVTLLRH